MRVDPDKLSEARVDLAVVGGGATGAFIAWAATLRGLSVALLEKDDFCGATSFANSRLIHGGLRYLRQGQISVVRESLAERHYWLSAAPHLVRRLGFLMLPKNRWQRYVYRAGLYLYEWLDRQSDLPAPRMLPFDEVVKIMPFSRKRRGGAVLYYDAQMIYPERLVIAALQGASERGARVANYVRASRIERSSDGLLVHFRDLLTNGTGRVTARTVVNATGPWADLLPTPERKPAFEIRRSAGIHLVTPQLTSDFAVVSAIRGRHVFVLPWENHSLVGTTDEPFSGDPDEYRVSERSVERLLSDVNAALPGLNLVHSDVLHVYGGLRPLVGTGGPGDTYRASRRAEIVAHETPGLYSVIGGKWTTSRALAERFLDYVCEQPGRSAETALPGGDPRETARSLGAKHPELSPGLLASLVTRYGSRAEAVLAHCPDDEPELATPRPTLPGEARHAVLEEAACHLSDVVFRRTGCGYFGAISETDLWSLAATMGRLLRWTVTQTEREVETVLGLLGRQP